MKNELENKISEIFVLPMNIIPRTSYFAVLLINLIEIILIVNRITLSSILPDDGRYSENVCILNFII